MPFYAFHLDVPAPPDVVTERVRAAVGKAPTFWESLNSSWKGPRPSGFPFVGSVGPRSFRIRRDIRYRNSFLPLIRGKIVPTSNGSRVNVFMFMHPASFVFMLAWFGFLVVAEWRLLDFNIAQSYLPLGMIAFGLMLSLGGFFYEALKVMPLLSEAVFNPAIVTVPEADPTLDLRARTIAPPTENSAGPIVALVVVTLLLVGGLALLNLYDRPLRKCPAFAAALDLTSRSAAARALLGEPIKAGLAVRGMVHQDRASAYAILAIPVVGPAGKGTLYVVANRIANGWDIERAVLQEGSPSRRLDLSPPTQPESFRYPAAGRVYILPLDDAAESDVKELPAYYKARLDLDVTVLPTQELGSGTVDAKAKQVIAEKALTSIEQTHREIAEDLDSVILGVTSQDMNIQTSGWGFATNYRHGRFGIISTARLHGMPWYAGSNPEAFAVRVRKLATKNLALLHYPVDLSADATSVLASSAFTTADVDAMGENFGGEFGSAPFVASESDELCLAILQGPGGKQSVRLDCVGDPPADSRFEMFETYPAIPLFVMSRADFSFADQPAFSFVRKYRPQDDRSRAFGIGATDSFDIFPVGDSQTFSAIDLVLADGGAIHYTRTSPGESYSDAKLRAGSYLGSPFSLSSLVWNSNGWDLATIDGWTYRFPSSGPDRTWQQSALIGIHSLSGQTFGIRRSSSGDLQEVRSPDGTSIQFSCDAVHRITSAKEGSGRSVLYEYDMAGRLVHVHDGENGDEFYEYDPANRLTYVLDAQHHALLANTYGYLGEIRSQTLSDGRKLLYEEGYSENHRMDYLKLTLPNGYTVEWLLTRHGLARSWPRPPLGADKTSHR